MSPSVHFMFFIKKASVFLWVRYQGCGLAPIKVLDVTVKHSKLAVFLSSVPTMLFSMSHFDKIHSADESFLPLRLQMPPGNDLYLFTPIFLVPNSMSDT